MDSHHLRETDLFRNLDGLHLAHLEAIVDEVCVPKGEILFREGDKAVYFFVILRGRVRISKIVPGMGEEALAVLDAGSYFGEMELINPSMARVAQATAHEDCILQRFSCEDFHALLNTDRDLAVAVLWGFCRTLSSRLRDTDDKVAATFALAQFQ